MIKLVFTRAQKRYIDSLVAEARTQGYRQGFETGAADTKRQLSPSIFAKETIEAKIKLINAVGQALQAQNSLLSGLGQVFDCGPR